MELQQIIGDVPKHINGYMLKNSSKPIYGIKYNHPLDGHGYINKFHFNNGVIKYQGLRVNTESYSKELKARKQIYRSIGTNVSNSRVFDMKLNNFSSIAVFETEGKVYSLYEGGLPYIIDPVTNETIGIEDMGIPFLSNLGYVPSTVHPKIHEGETYNAVSGSIGLIVYTNKGMKCSIMYPPGKQYYFHDFIVSDTSYIFYLCPIDVDIVNSIFISKKTILESIKFIKGCKILKINRDTGNQTWYDVPDAFDYPCLHIAHYEESDSENYIDICLLKHEFELHKVDSPHSFEHSKLTRIDFKNGSCDEIMSHAGDMPIKLNNEKIVLINQNEISIYNKNNLEIISKEIDCDKIEEPCVYKNNIMMLSHHKNHTELHVFDEYLNEISRSILARSISYGFHGMFYIPN